MTEASLHALEILRNPQLFSWSVAPLFVIVFYLYLCEIEKRNWNGVIAATATWCLEFSAEILNALVLYFTDYSALWVTPGHTSFLVFAGLNIEISMMFAVAYLGFIKMLPQNKDTKILGFPNRWFFVGVASFICVTLEVLLNTWGVLVWDYTYWSRPHIWSIIIFAYIPSVAFLYWMYDLKSLKFKLLITGTLLTLDIVGVIVFVGVLKWI